MSEHYNKRLKRFPWYQQATAASNEAGSLGHKTGTGSPIRRPLSEYAPSQTATNLLDDGRSRNMPRTDVTPTDNDPGSLIMPNEVFNEGTWRPLVNHDDPGYFPGERTGSPEPKIENDTIDGTYIKREIPDDAFETQLLEGIEERGIKRTSTSGSTSGVTTTRRQIIKRMAPGHSTCNGCKPFYNGRKSGCLGSIDPTEKCLKHKSARHALKAAKLTTEASLGAASEE